MNATGFERVRIRADKIGRGDWLPTGVGSNTVEVVSVGRDEYGRVIVTLAQHYGDREYRLGEYITVLRRT